MSSPFGVIVMDCIPLILILGYLYAGGNMDISNVDRLFKISVTLIIHHVSVTKMIIFEFNFIN